MRVYLDESVSVALAAFLAQHGVHCLTARDAGHLGITDEQQLRYAEESECALFTHDARDFLRLAQEWQKAGRSHRGIILSHQVPLRELTRRFQIFLHHCPATDLTNQILWLPPVKD